MIVVVTGALGFIGSELVRAMLQDDRISIIYLLIRGRGEQTAAERFALLAAQWKLYFATTSNALEKIRVVSCDLSRCNEMPQFMDADYFYHCAASIDLGMPLLPSRKVNLYGTQNALRLARRMPNLKRFVHYSTAYVLATCRGRVTENHVPKRYNNDYEKSKYEAEQCVRQSGLPYTILRPSMVVGHSQHGYIKGFKIIYAVLRVWLTGRIPRAPLDKHARVDIVPVDYIVRASLALAQDDDALGEVFQLCAADNAPSPVSILQYAVRAFNLESPQTAPPWMVKFFSSRIIRSLTGYGLREILGILHFHLPYLGTRGRVFDTSKADLILRKHGVLCPSLSQFGDVMFEFCRDSRWGKKPFLLSPLFRNQAS